MFAQEKRSILSTQGIYFIEKLCMVGRRAQLALLSISVEIFSAKKYFSVLAYLCSLNVHGAVTLYRQGTFPTDHKPIFSKLKNLLMTKITVKYILFGQTHTLIENGERSFKKKNTFFSLQLCACW
jgi:hypothetical protein